MNMPARVFLAISVVLPHARANPVFRSVQEDAGSGDGDVSTTVPDYTPEQCTAWIDAAYAADANKSGGLSADEYHAFLMGVDEPSHADGYFDQFAESYASLSWNFKVLFMSLACRCVLLPGYDEKCCMGADAEIPLVGISEEDIEALPPERQRAVAEYRADVCNSVAATFEEAMPTPSAGPTRSPVVTAAPTSGEPESSAAPTAAPASAEVEIVLDVVGSVLDYRSFDYSTIFNDTNEGVPDYYNAQDVQTNKDDNGVLDQVVESFEKLSFEVARELGADGTTKRNLRASSRALQVVTLKPVQVTNIGCPKGLPYAPEGAYCLNFNFNIIQNDDEIRDEAYFASLAAAINKDGRLYEIVVTDYPNTNVTGLGDPGKGIEYADLSVPVPTPVESPIGGSEESPGVGPGAIFFIVIAVVLVPMALTVMYTRYQKARAEEHQERLSEYEATRDTQPDAARATSTAKDEDVGAVPGERQPSLQAEPSAVPVPDEGDDASSAPSVWSESQDEGRKSSSFVDEGGEPGVTAGSALAAMGAAGAAATFASSNMGGDDRNREAMTEEKAASYREVRALVEQIGAPKTSDELLAAYEGREDQLLTYLRNLRSKKETSAEIASLVEATNSPKPASELMIIYKGREEELIKMLRKLKSKQDVERVESLMASVDTGNKSAEDLLGAYEGREFELIRHLEKLQQRQTKAQVKSLVDNVKPGKSAEDLLSTYEGRESELIKNLEKMASLNALVESTNPGMSTQEMLAEFAGREDEMVRSLREKKSRQDMEKVEFLVASVGSGKTAEELLGAYEGREQELIRHLEKLQQRQTKAEVKSLVESVEPGKSTRELLDAYEGREEDLVKNLRKLELKQTQKSVRSLVDDVNPGKSADELLTAWKGREKELEADLEKMKAKQEKKQAKAKVESLVESVKPGKSTKELLLAYEGRESELIGHLTKMQAKQEKQAKKAATSAETTETSALAARTTMSPDFSESVRTLVAETNPGKSAEQLMDAYAGREDILLKNLKRMKAKKEKKASKLASADSPSLASATPVPGVGKEDKDKGPQDIPDVGSDPDLAVAERTKGSPADDGTVGEEGEGIGRATVDSDTAVYKGEPYNISDFDVSSTAPPPAPATAAANVDTTDTPDLRAQISSLIASVKPGMSEDELMAAYEGRYEELIKHLKKLKSYKSGDS